MQVFQVRQEATNAILWTGSASDAGQALDAMAQAAGYRDQSALPEGVRRGGLTAESVSFGALGTERQRIVQGGRAGRTAQRGGSVSFRNTGSAAANR